MIINMQWQECLWIGLGSEKLKRSAFSKQHNATKKDEEGIRLLLRTYDSNGKTQRSMAMRVIRCR